MEQGIHEIEQCKPKISYPWRGVIIIGLFHFLMSALLLIFFDIQLDENQLLLTYFLPQFIIEGPIGFIITTAIWLFVGYQSGRVFERYINLKYRWLLSLWPAAVCLGILYCLLAIWLLLILPIMDSGGRSIWQILGAP